MEQVQTTDLVVVTGHVIQGLSIYTKALTTIFTQAFAPSHSANIATTPKV